MSERAAIPSVHVHLDPIGGVAGDMFAAAALDLHPEWEAPLRADLDAAGFAPYAQIGVSPHRDAALTGRRFEVREIDPDAPDHRRFRQIRELLAGGALPARVRDRAVAIFTLLAQAEGRVHGVAPDEVSFHEVGAWDSIVDVVTAAWLVERLGVPSWSCTPLPMGSGRVQSAHGRLPLPAPAAALLLEGFPLVQDEHQGERVTPTGAAIVRHLTPSFEPLRAPRRLAGVGVGFGTRRIAGLSNVLRMLAFEAADATDVPADAPAADAPGRDAVALIGFEVDDQTPEDLAVALERLRAEPAVRDVVQWPVSAKRGRLASHVQVLAAPEQLDAVLARCFSETTTLGLRWQIVERAVLARGEQEVVLGEDLGADRARVKWAARPGGVRTVKPAMEDLAATAGGHPERERRRRRLSEHALGAAEGSRRSGDGD